MIQNILEQASPKTLAIAIVFTFTLVRLASWINTEYKIRSLGGRARKAKTWLPWGTHNALLPSRSKPVLILPQISTSSL